MCVQTVTPGLSIDNDDRPIFFIYIWLSRKFDCVETSFLHINFQFECTQMQTNCAFIKRPPLTHRVKRSCNANISNDEN